MFAVSPFFNLTLGAVATFAAYMTFWLSSTMGIGAIPVAIALAALFSFALEFFAYKPLRESGSSSMILLVVSLGIYTVFESVLHLAFGPQYHILGNAFDSNLINLGLTEIPLVQLIIIVSCFLIYFLLNLFLHHTFLGKQIRAIHDSSELANIIGIKKDKIIMMVSLITGLILGITGVLVGYDTGMEITMGFNLLFKGLRRNHWRHA
jgi:branched-subunit amino acid ABC-type transport system permease component